MVARRAGGRPPVTDEDVIELLREGRELSRAEGREPVHVIPLTFALDNTDHIVDPRGLYCSTLDARLHVIDVSLILVAFAGGVPATVRS